MHLRRQGRGLSVGALGLILAAAAPARAAETDEQRAEALFREGRAAVERGDDAAGCPKFVESLRILERAASTVNLAQCEERKAHLVAALALWSKGVALLAGDKERLKLARERVADLERRVPRFSIKLDGSAPENATVLVDGVALAAAAAATPQRLDPGDHVVVVDAPGRVSFRTTVTLAEGQQGQVLAVLPPLTQGSAAPEARGPSGLRTAGFVVGGVGVVSLVVGAATGALTIAKKNAVNDNCAPTCNAAARDAATAGKTFSAVSTATFIVGAAGLAAGVVMIVLGKPGPSPPAVAVAPAALPGGAGLVLTGRF